jgi:UDP-N-acetylglucosamine 2-epimerase (non-hydrolysing)
MKKIISVVGARPNFMKVAPIHKAFCGLSPGEHKVLHLICHTGQHYDEKMSKIFFEDLELPKPDYFLGVGSGSHAEQTGNVMKEFEKVLIREEPDLVIVVGDVNSTIACSLTAVKMGIKIAHVEAGLRSFDRSMPEEINRVLTDAISDFLFITEKSAWKNLKDEGIDESKIFMVGNVMIDSLIRYLTKTRISNILDSLSLLSGSYALVTLHRPSNVDLEDGLRKIVTLLNKLSTEIKVVFPIHPRTKKNLESHSLIKSLSGDIILTDPIGYIDFISLVKNSKLVLTDSGGIQEETTYLGIPCVTLRNNTERPITVEIGTNILAGDDRERALESCLSILGGELKNGSIPDLWDGHSGERIVEILTRNLVKKEGVICHI